MSDADSFSFRVTFAGFVLLLIIALAAAVLMEPPPPFGPLERAAEADARFAEWKAQQALKVHRARVAYAIAIDEITVEVLP